MKIGNPADKAVGVTPAPLPADAAKTSLAPPAGGTAAGPAVPDASANVAFSSAASNLMSTGSSAEFDAEKVARLTQAIANGSFKVNPDVIADKLIANAQELLSGSRS